MPETFIIVNDIVRANAVDRLQTAAVGTVVTFAEPKRTTPQNSRLWAMISDVFRQAKLCDNFGKRYSTDDLKYIFMRACKHETRYIHDLNGEPFPVGFRSSKLSKEQMGVLMDFIEWFGTENGVEFHARECGG